MSQNTLVGIYLTGRLCGPIQKQLSILFVEPVSFLCLSEVLQATTVHIFQPITRFPYTGVELSCYAFEKAG